MPTLIDLPGRQGKIADAYFERAVAMGRKALAVLSQTAAARLIDSGTHFGHFFDGDEINKLVTVLAATLGTADLLGRARTRQEWTATLAAHGEIPGLTEGQAARLNDVIHGWLSEDEKAEDAPDPMVPEVALNYFRGLVPTLGVDPERWGRDLRRRVFTLAAATDAHMLRTTQRVVAERLESGEAAGGPAAIRDVLERGGVTPANPQYAEMVFRTNAIDAYNTAATDELQHPDVIETFPVFEYSNPDDERSREAHAARNGKFYPSSVPFVQVRGTGIEDAANCRCTFISISKWRWAKLKAAGAQIAEGYPDVPSMDEAGAQPRRVAAELPMIPAAELPAAAVAALPSTQAGVTFAAKPKRDGSVILSIKPAKGKSAEVATVVPYRVPPPLVFDRLGVERGSKIFMVQSIEVPAQLQGKGVGSETYLRALAQHPEAWHYNSQATPSAHRALLRLQAQGLIELRKFKDTSPDEDAGPHVKRITQKGLEFLFGQAA